MISPKKPLLSLIDPDRASARIGFLVAATIPLLAIGLTHFYNQKESPEPAKNFAGNGSDQRLIEFCSKNVKSNRAFVLFQHGTCVVVEDLHTTEEIKKQALALLQETASPDARFICTPIEKQNLIVSYTKPVFHLRFHEDMQLFREQIENDYRRFLTEKEKSDVTLEWEPPFHAKVGLRSRARLMKDAVEPIVAHVIAPRSIEEKASVPETASISF